MKIFIARPRGFCAGVARAVEVVELALKIYGPPIYVRHSIVHNQHVVSGLKEKGAVFTDNLDDIPKGNRVIFSAHGVSPAVRKQARERNLKVIDATCPLVTKVHLEAIRYAQKGYSIILIGHKGHVEVEGTAGEAPENTQIVETVEDVDQLKVPEESKIIVLTQTTLSVDDTREIIQTLYQRFPLLIEPPKEDICYATQNRQEAVKSIAPICDLTLVIGDPESSNSNRLREVAEKAGSRAFLIRDTSDINPDWLEPASVVAVTSSASAPEDLVEKVIAYLQKRGTAEIEEIQKMKENIQFPLPREILKELKK